MQQCPHTLVLAVASAAFFLTVQYCTKTPTSAAIMSETYSTGATAVIPTLVEHESKMLPALAEEKLMLKFTSETCSDYVFSYTTH